MKEGADLRAAGQTECLLQQLCSCGPACGQTVNMMPFLRFIAACWTPRPFPLLLEDLDFISTEGSCVWISLCEGQAAVVGILK